MKLMAGASAVAAALRLLLWQPPIVVGVEQRDEWRSNVDRPSVAISADGRYIAFTSYAQLASADTNRSRDVYVLDRLDGRVTLESLAADGRASNVDSAHPGISGDGRFLVYETLAASSGGCEVVLRDRVQQSARIISSAGAADASRQGWSGAPAISADGRYVAFISTANLAPGVDANGSATDVYLFDALSGATRRASLDSAGMQPSSGAAMTPDVSGDGRFVVFASTARLTPVVSSHQRTLSDQRRFPSLVYVRDTKLGTTVLVSADRGGQPSDGGAWDPAISDDGRYIAFVSAAANLAASHRNPAANVFVADARAGGIELVSRAASGGSANGRSGAPSLSADGRFVVFQSDASNLVCSKNCDADAEDINLVLDVFLLDRRSDVMMRVSTDHAAGWMEASSGPAIDGAGGVIAFSSRHPIDAADTKNDFDLFVRSVPPYRRAYR